MEVIRVYQHVVQWILCWSDGVTFRFFKLNSDISRRFELGCWVYSVGLQVVVNVA